MSLDIGRKASNFTVYADKELIFSRYITLGSDSFGYFDPADESRNYAQINSLELDSGLKEGINLLIHEIKRSIDYYQSNYKEIMPQKLVLTGGTANYQGMIEFLQQELNIPVSVGLQNIEQRHQGNRSEVRIDPSYAVAIGLAMREV